MSKRFAEFFELEALGSKVCDLEEMINTCKDTINKNADAGVELTEKVDKLEERLEVVVSRLNEVIDHVNSEKKKENGSGTGVILLTFAGVFGFLYLLNEINKLEKEIKALKNQTAKKGGDNDEKRKE